MISISLPWPHKDLSPNARKHRMAISGLKKRSREEGRLLAISHKNSIPEDGRLYLRVTACPPDRRKRDRDNVMASLKAHLDGIADGLGVDDSRFVPLLMPDWGEVVKGGLITVEILDSVEEWIRPFQTTNQEENGV